MHPECTQCDRKRMALLTIAIFLQLRFFPLLLVAYLFYYATITIYHFCVLFAFVSAYNVFFFYRNRMIGHYK